MATGCQIWQRKKKSLAHFSYRVKRLKANFPTWFKKQSLEGFWMSTLMHYRDVYLLITADILQNLKGIFSISAAMRTVEQQKYELQDAPSSCRRFMKTVFFSCCRWLAFKFLFLLICFGFKPLSDRCWILQADVMEWDGYIFAVSLLRHHAFLSCLHTNMSTFTATRWAGSRTPHRQLHEQAKWIWHP